MLKQNIKTYHKAESPKNYDMQVFCNKIDCSFIMLEEKCRAQEKNVKTKGQIFIYFFKDYNHKK